MNQKTKCECPEPGWCHRHHCQKTPHWHHLCQTHAGYFQAWEAGYGPGQSGSREPPVEPHGPGTELAKLLRKFGLKYRRGCGCKDRARLMDRWGPDVCAERIDVVVGWLREEANKRRLPFVDMAAKLLIRRAIHNARQWENTHGNHDQT